MPIQFFNVGANDTQTYTFAAGTVSASFYIRGAGGAGDRAGGGQGNGSLFEIAGSLGGKTVTIVTGEGGFAQPDMGSFGNIGSQSSVTFDNGWQLIGGGGNNAEYGKGGKGGTTATSGSPPAYVTDFGQFNYPGAHGQNSFGSIGGWGAGDGDTGGGGNGGDNHGLGAAGNGGYVHLVARQDAAGTIPDPTGHAGEYLTNNGSVANWSSITSISSSNILINSAHNISQESVNTSLTGIGSTGGTDIYITDQWKIRAKGTLRVSGQRIQSTGLSGFANALRITTTTAESSISSGDYLTVEQPIEGIPASRLGFGVSSPAVVALGVWVRSSVTGTFSTYLTNSARSRSKPSVFTVNAANTWEFKTFLFSGDSSGTWLTDNGVGLRVAICLAAGSTLQGTADVWTGSEIMTTSAQTNFASATSRTFDMTGTIAIPLINGSSVNPLTSGIASLLINDPTEEFILCKRYFQKSANVATPVKTANDQSNTPIILVSSIGNAVSYIQVQISPMRAAPTTTTYPYTTPANTFRVSNSAGTDYAAHSGDTGAATESSFLVGNNSGSALTITGGCVIFGWYADARLT